MKLACFDHNPSELAISYRGQSLFEAKECYPTISVAVAGADRKWGLHEVHAFWRRKKTEFQMIANDQVLSLYHVARYRLRKNSAMPVGQPPELRLSPAR